MFSSLLPQFLLVCLNHFMQDLGQYLGVLGGVCLGVHLGVLGIIL
jgi:hypothetical protein